MKMVLVWMLSTVCVFSFAQKKYTQGDVVKNFSAGQMLNYKTKTTTLSLLQSDVTILDFFGTWCAPCVKALPHLSALQAKYPRQLSIVLISTEETIRLQDFMGKRKDFPLPVIVDADEKITSLFKPVSYPYTVVLNKASQIIAITNAAALTDDKVAEWLQDKGKTATKKLDTTQLMPTTSTATIPGKSNNKLVQLSQQFMYAARTNAPSESYRDSLKNTSFKDLESSLSSDNEKKAFWINIYNGYTQFLLKQNHDAYKSRGSFYRKKQIPVAGNIFSLDDIEHGILRRSKIKWSLGYFNKLFPSKTEKTLRVNTLDFRIHFALNCGAESCPPIAFYNPESIDEQLKMATNAYLTAEAVYDSLTNTLLLPALMSWFRADFGGKKSMKQLVKQLGIVPQEKNPSIKFKEYNWNIYLDNYKN